MSFGLKGILRAWGPGLVRVSGSFTVAASAVALTRPSRTPWVTLTRKATGVYLVTLQQAFLSVESAWVGIGPGTGKAGAAFDTAVPAFAEITQDFMTVNGAVTQWVADSTNKNLVITVINQAQNALVDVPANYRCAFAAVLCESSVNK